MDLRFDPTQRDVIVGSQAAFDMGRRLLNLAATRALLMNSAHLALPNLARVERDGGVYRRLN